MALRALAAAAAVGAAAGARLTPSPVAADVIPGEYIAVLHRNTTSALHSGVADRLGGARVAIGAFRAVTGRLDLAAALADAAVAYVEHNEVVRMHDAKPGWPPHPHPHHPVHPTRVCPDVQASGASWGQSRTTVRTEAEVSAQYLHAGAWGDGVDAYVLDTGVYCEHNELRGHCEWGLTVTGTEGVDMNGHGTHVAGTIAGVTYGVAKSAHIIAVKVLGDSGSGTKEGVIRGAEWAVARMKERGRKGVGNLSLGGSFSQAQNDAMDAVVDEGLPLAISAGNSNNDACTQSPASTPKAITVMSSDRADLRSSFSSYGPCSDIIAPGSSIMSAYIGSPTATASLSGTSMAAPHVAGVVAQYLGLEPAATPTQVKAHLSSTALTNTIDFRCTNDICRNSPDRMLHIAC